MTVAPDTIFLKCSHQCQTDTDGDSGKNDWIRHAADLARQIIKSGSAIVTNTPTTKVMTTIQRISAFNMDEPHIRNGNSDMSTPRLNSMMPKIISITDQKQD